MRSKYLLLFIFAIFLNFTGKASDDKKPNEIRILYVGGNSDLNPDNKTNTQESIEKSIRERKEAFTQLLKTYFDTVTAIDATDYTPDMSDNYDVTIFDGLPPAIEQRTIEYDAYGKIKTYTPARYLPDDFSSPCITIGNVSDRIGARLGIKNDWFCLCLDACAHHINLKHPIFHKPFKTKMTLEKLPTPEEAFYYQFMFKEDIPDSLMMWRIQTKGYKTDLSFNIGLVSRPWGYTDSPDCEYISSGVCAKSPDAVAIGRHANFFHWGFIASPLYMTDEAKVVFANTVVYIAKYKQTPLVRKYRANIATRETVKEMKYSASRASYDNTLKYLNSITQQQEEAIKKLKAKQTKGEKLTDQETTYLQNYQPQEMPVPSFIDHLKQAVGPDLYTRFGNDESLYAQYYDSNKPYYYGGGNTQGLAIDEDAKAWGIANNNKEILNKAISCLEKGEEIERAKRILARYTLCDFSTPSEWRKWYDKYESKMFFTESGGWFFMINGSKNIPGNDYSILERRKTILTNETSQISEAIPDANNPIIITTQGKIKANNLIEVQIKINLYKGFHIYKEVGMGDPYIPMEIKFDLPEDCYLEGKIQMPAAANFGNNGTKIYEGEIIMSQIIRCEQLPTNIKFTFGYQCCDSHSCQPPQNKEFNVIIKK